MRVPSASTQMHNTAFTRNALCYYLYSPLFSRGRAYSLSGTINARAMKHNVFSFFFNSRDAHMFGLNIFAILIYANGMKKKNHGVRCGFCALKTGVNLKKKVVQIVIDNVRVYNYYVYMQID